MKSGLFSGCSKLEDVYISSGATTIEKSAFAHCSKLTTVMIPMTVKTISKTNTFLEHNSELTIICASSAYAKTYASGQNIKYTTTRVSGVALDLGEEKNVQTKTINTGDKVTFLAEITPNNATVKRVKWVSSNPEVASVSDDGEVTALKAGTAEIYAITIDLLKKAKCVLTVSDVPVTEVTLNKIETIIDKEKKETLVATIKPDNATNKKLTWKSSNTKVATVDDNGVITAVAKGTSTITVTTKDGNKTASCKVTVNVPVSGVALNKTSLTLNKGKTEIFGVTVSPDDATNKNVIWTSSNSKVATVSGNGVLTAIAKGTTTITATTEDGNKTASCVVTVNVPVTGVSLNKTTVTISKGETEKLVATVKPDDANNKNVTWVSSNPEVAIVSDSGVVKAIAKGSSIITVTTKDENKTANCVVTVTEVMQDDRYDVDETNKIVKSIPDNTTAQQFLGGFGGSVKRNNVKLGENDLVGTGCIFVKEDGTEYTLVVTGDITGDGKITGTDLLKIKRDIVKMETLNNIQIKAGDLNGNGSITATDLLQIKRKIVGL